MNYIENQMNYKPKGAQRRCFREAATGDQI
jgi:hypothetical protein